MASAYLSTRLYHQCDTGSIPGNGAGAFIKLCVGSILGHKDFFSGPSGFPPSERIKHFLDLWLCSVGMGLMWKAPRGALKCK